MSKKKDIDILEEAIQKLRVSEKITKYAIDEKRLNEEMSKPGWAERVEDTYKKYGIKQYDLSRQGEKQFRLDKLSKNSDLTDKQLDKMWKEYQHRDDLIISGQYEDIRAELYRENYIKAMKNSNIYPEAIKNVESLTLDKWKLIMELPSTDKKNPKDTLMPHIGGFYYGGASDSVIQGVISEIKAAFRTLKVDYVDTVDAKEKTKEAISRVSKTYKFDNKISVANKLDNLIRTLPRYNRELISEEPYTEDNLIEQRLVIVGANLPRKRVKISKSGDRYIPFVGSTRSGTKNEKITKAILEGYDVYK